MPEELWTEVLDIVQEAVIQTIPKKNPERSDRLSQTALMRGPDSENSRFISHEAGEAHEEHRAGREQGQRAVGTALQRGFRHLFRL